MAVICEMKLDAILAGRALSRDRLEKPCSSECLESMGPKLSRWKILCPSLGLTSGEEKTIFNSHSNNPQRRAGMLSLWREKFGEKATYLRLASGFEEAKMTDMIFSLLDWFTEKERPSSGRRVTVSVPKLDEKPNPQQLIRVVGKSGKEIVIRDQIMFDWEDLYRLMNPDSPTDETNAKVTELRQSSRRQDEEACREVLLMWLSGATSSRQPVTWATFIGLLREVRQEELANELETELNS